MLDLADIVVTWCSSRVFDLDWDKLHPRAVNRIRRLIEALAFTVAVGGAIAVAFGHYLPTLGLLLLAAGLDVLEGSVGRVSRTETPVGRWVTGLAGHFAELVFITGVALDQLRLGRTGATVVLLVAVSLAQYGSLVRISARRVGKIDWQAGPSMNERALRFVSLLAYVTLSLLGVLAAAAPWLTAVAFGGLGLLQTIRIAIEVKQEPVESIMTVVQKKDGKCESFVEEATPFSGTNRNEPVRL